MIINEDSYNLGIKPSVIREVFEKAKLKKEEIGEENVFDFSIGNPSIKSPDIVKETLLDLITNYDPIKLHEYTSNAGDLNVRNSIAEYLNKTYNAKEDKNYIFLTCGAAASLSITLNAIINKGEEVIVIAPFFAEYTVYIEKAGGKQVISLADSNTQLIDFNDLKDKINKNTKAIIINSPNNPTGVVYDEEELKKLSELIEQKQKEYNITIFTISDEPYRELVYDNKKVPYTSKFIKNTISCYSFSKSLSLPGERIGYICVTNEVEEKEKVFKSICGAARSLGYICAPSLFQKMIPYVIGKTSDISIYDKNRKYMYDMLTKLKFKTIYPSGAFYLFVKSPIEDTDEFINTAQKYNLYFVRSNEFGITGFVRISYCTTYEMIVKSEESFKKLAKEYFDV